MQKPPCLREDLRMSTPIMNRASRERLAAWNDAFWAEVDPEPDYEWEGYHCRSCDAILGDSPRPCPRCDGLPDGSLLSLEHEAELRHHEYVYGDTYGEQFNPTPFDIRRFS